MPAMPRPEAQRSTACVVSCVADAGCEEALEWLVAVVLPDGGRPFRVAARNGDLAALRCLARLGCPCGAASGDQSVFDFCLADKMPLPVLRLLVELGCPVDLAACRYRAPALPDEVREWLLQEADQRLQQQPGPQEAAV
ncbi:hypothetical protein GPECTOR_12g360 [Gonium pectorale]|uniref:Ankyrin repeat domain-containing protein n=1 Tax=Gonium pectorale TaxID=33097 RepID=A0A150GNN5_GONPE|nr:hypothetical protein GPECTOR_12g360 [Gonium pectorale]|eukprot:KXZ51398.1 hypothetical protein GPECTOR_12g360 [Gonium pectorale]